MNAVVEPIAFQLPKKPKVKEQEPLPDQRKVAVLPFKAVFDPRLTHGALQALAALCAYCNRAGITWVSQARLAKDLGITQQAYSKQFKQLVDCGYVEVIKKPFKGQRTATTRVIYDPTVLAEDAIAMVSSKEDARPPWLAQQEKQEMEDNTPDREGLRRIANLVAGALKQPTKPKEYQMPKTGETATVKKMKEDIAKAKVKRTTNNPQVVTQAVDKSNDTEVSHNSQVVAVHNPQVVLNTVSNNYKESIKVIDKKELNKYLDSYDQLEVVDVQRLLTCMTHVQVREAMDTLLPLFAAEGLNPSSHILADAILQMHRDAT
jgi:DNA-binding MarR family transcriptional regulator/NADPH-dependent 7-cyano-7-deazaguanine reductase QueF-like protein